MQKGKEKCVAVLFGGPSFEHEISILTGVFVLNILKNSGYTLLPVYIDTEGEFYSSPAMTDLGVFTKKRSFPRVRFVRNTLCRADGRQKPVARIDCALNCCHGGFGEGGGLSALLDLYGIPTASPACAPSAVCMDKALFKTVLEGLHIPCVPSVALSESEYYADEEGTLRRVEQALGYPVVVKPARLGSSIGVGVAKDRAQLCEKLRTAFSFDGEVLAEKYLSGRRDVNCAAYGMRGKVMLSRTEEPFSREEILSFGEKYLQGGKERKSRSPADIPAEAEAEIRAITEKLYIRLRLNGIVRADFLYADDKVWFNEMNTVPGSLAYYLFSEKFTEARKLLCSLIEEGMRRYSREKKTVRLTGVLSEMGTVRK